MFELRAVIAEFLLSKNHLLTEYFLDKHFLARVAYLADMLSALSSLNASLQGRDTIIFEAVTNLVLSLFSVKTLEKKGTTWTTGTLSQSQKLYRRRIY